MPEEKQAAFIDPYSTEEDEAALKALDDEISQAAASLESDFAKFAAGKVDEKLEELFFENKEGFFLEILKLQNEFLSGLRAKQGKANELREGIGLKKSFKAIEEAKNEFLQANPDANEEALMEFYASDLSPRVKASLDKLEPREFFVRLYAEFKKQNNENDTQKPEEKKEEKEVLPQRLSGSNAEAAGNSNENEAYFNRY